MLTRALMAFLMISVVSAGDVKAATTHPACQTNSNHSFPEKRRALVVGNATYGDTLGNLPNSIIDAEGVSATLCGLGFAVTLVENANKDEVYQAVDAFKASNQQKEVRLFYYSGHGTQLKDYNYLIPAGLNAVPTTTQGLIDLNDIYKAYAAEPPGTPSGETALKLFIVDACRRDDLGDEKGFALPSEAYPDSVIAFATSPGRVAYAGDSGQSSVYTSVLLQDMKVPGSTLLDVFSRVRRELWQSSHRAQLSWENISTLQNFYFQPPPSVKFNVVRSDDIVVVTVNGSTVAFTGAPAAAEVPTSILRPGPNPFQIYVYNQKTRRNNQPWESREGWAYTVAVTLPNGKSCTLSGGRDNVDHDLDEWGATFLARSGVINVGSDGNTVVHDNGVARHGTEQSRAPDLQACL